MTERTRRDVLKGIGVAGASLLTPTVVASESEERFILDVGDTVSFADRTRLNGTDLDIRHDQEAIGYLVVEGTESEVEDLPYDYAPDMDLELETPSESYVPSEEELEAMQEAVDEADVDPDNNHFDVPSFYGYQWDKQYLDQSTALQEATGEGVTVAIIDSSMYLDHPDLVENANQDASISVIDDGYDEFHPAGSDHGTHVAGIAAASDGGGVTGMAPDAEIIGVRYFSPFAIGGSSDFIQAVMYSARNADVINTSLGFPPLPDNRFWQEFFAQYYQDVDEFARGQDAVWVSSAGNAGTNVDEEDVIIMPAGLEGNLSISATGPIGYGYQLFNGESLVDPPYSASFYTDHGADYVDLSGPGGDADLSMNEELPPGSGIPVFAYDLVFNTIFDASGGGVSAAWGWKAGTSMSAPNVAGVAALLREQFPDAPAHQIQRLLKEHAQNVGNQELHGNGHVGMMEALNATDPSDQRPGRNPREGGRDDSGRDDSSDGDGSGDGGESGRGGDDDGGDDRGR